MKIENVSFEISDMEGQVLLVEYEGISDTFIFYRKKEPGRTYLVTCARTDLAKIVERFASAVKDAESIQQISCDILSMGKDGRCTERNTAINAEALILALRNVESCLAPLSEG